MDIVVQKNIVVPMRDGVSLATDVYRPASGGPWPALIARLPYSKELLATLVLLMPDPLRLAQAGYAVVVQDCRGCYGSAGQPTPFVHEADDGADTIAWAATQPWSSGAVGMVGGSYLGVVQWLAAAEGPPALRTIAPYITSDQLYAPWIYQGGAFQLGFCLFWALGSLAIPELHRRLATRAATMAEVGAAMRALGNITALWERLPLLAAPELESTAPFYHDWLRHPCDDPYWQALAVGRRLAQIRIPTLNIGGWYDPFLAGTLSSYQGMRDQGGSPEARRPHLIVGPWSHGVWHGAFPERDFGLLASTDAFDLTGVQLRWFDTWLKGAEHGIDDEPPVKLFVMGVDRWREEDDWPLPDTQYRKLYLRSSGRANTRYGDGTLAWEPPVDEPADHYAYDPHDPTPTCGGATLLPGALAAVNAGPRDQCAVEDRADVLVYTTPPLAHDLEVTGPIRLILFAASSARDTDFTGKLVDVFPDGRALLLTDGILRTRYRRSYTQPEPLAPGTVYELPIDLVATANVFRAGHRIRLEVSSSNFPRFDRNTNTGGCIAQETEADLVVAANRVFHDHARPSHLILPIIDRDEPIR
jgi:putative CocE/NonD family hydrolase